MGWLERGVREKWLVVGVRDASGRRYGRRQWKLKMRLERSRRQESWDESFLQDSRIFPSMENKAAFASLRPPRVASMNFHENHVRIFIPFLLQHPALFFHRALLSGFGLSHRYLRASKNFAAVSCARFESVQYFSIFILDCNIWPIFSDRYSMNLTVSFIE